MSAQTYGPALLNINYMHAESLSMRMDRNLGINAFRVELLRLVALFEIPANVNGIGGCISIPEDVCMQTDCYRQFCHRGSGRDVSNRLFHRRGGSQGQTRCGFMG